MRLGTITLILTQYERIIYAVQPHFMVNNVRTPLSTSPLVFYMKNHSDFPE